LNYIYNMDERSSIDIDISMENSFEDLGMSLENVEEILRSSFQRTFKENGFKVFDIKLEKRPPVLSKDKEDFWGGYLLTFKVLDYNKWDKFNNDPEKSIEDMRRQAIPFTPDDKRKFSVDISRHEYCEDKRLEILDDYFIYVYTPKMIILEKLRAICQQTEEYMDIIESHQRRARAQDFFDIYITMKHQPEINLTTSNSIKVLKEVFKIKRVPLEILKKIEDYREFHRESFRAVEDTVSSSDIKPYDFYFDYVLSIIDDILKSL
ncbi:MAG: nucleotidyl transferase AbiEii/AbiGii toxin family protein, partial [bacterium]